MKYLIDRLKEPSTHISLAGLIQFVKTVAPQYAPVIDSASALLLSLAALKKG